jgi:integrase
MASVFKRKRDRQRRGASWYVAYVNGDGKRKTVKGCPDKAATEAMARKLESEADLRRRGIIDVKTDGYASHEAKPLTDHLEAWRAYLLGKGDSKRHANEGHARVVKLMTLAKATRLSDLTLARIQAALASLRGRGLALRTVHHHTRLVKNFTKWAWRDGRTRDDLLAHLQPPDNPESDRRRIRRALTVAELERLVSAAECGPIRRGLAGADRAMLYRIAAGTGYRSEELQSLTPEAFDLDGSYPTVTVEAGVSKRRRRDVQPIQAALASMLRPWVAGKANGQPIFPVDRWAILEAFKADLRDAGVEYETAEGIADFHAVRHSYVTALAKSNAPVKIVQSLARHSTPVLTLGVYTHLGLYDQAPALDALPDLTKPAPEPEPSTLAATGTDSVTPDRHRLSALCQRAEDGLRRDRSSQDVIADSPAIASMHVLPLKNRDTDGYSRIPTVADANGSVSAAGARPGLQNR